MSNETTKAKSSRTSAKTEVVVEEVAEKTPAKPIVAKDIDLNQLIVVQNGYQGRLVYKSARTNEKYVWPEFGSEQMIELHELRNAKNTWKKYFRDNWFMFDEEYAWVIDYLGMTPYYKNALKVDSFDKLFEKPASEIEKTVAKLSSGQKKSVAYRARQLIAEEKIDSNKAIAALEESLGIELVER